MNRKEIVQAVKVEFPKFSPTALSLATRPTQTGVTFVQRAAEIAASAEGLAVDGAVSPPKKREEKRKKDIAFRCRLSRGAARRVKNEMSRRSLSQQDLVEALLLAWCEWAEKEPLTTWQIVNGSKGGMVEADSTSENITNGNGGQ